MKILFLAANPVDVVTPLRIDKEIREIRQKIRMGPLRDQLQLVPEGAVRAEDLQELLMSHQPDIVHFSGHCSPSSGIMLEDENGNRKVVDREALADLFRILKGNIRVVVLNACYAKEQAQALATTIDFTIGMNAAIKDKDASIFAAAFYQSLSFGYSVKDAFDLAVNQLKLVDNDVAHVPVLLVRDGEEAAKSRIVEPSRVAVAGAFLPWLPANIAISLTTDVLRRFLADGWLDIVPLIVQSVFVLVALAGLVIGSNRIRRSQVEADQARSAAVQWQLRYEEERQSSSLADRKHQESESELTGQVTQLRTELENERKQKPTTMADGYGGPERPQINLAIFVLKSARGSGPSSDLTNELTLPRFPLAL